MVRPCVTRKDGEPSGLRQEGGREINSEHGGTTLSLKKKKRNEYGVSGIVAQSWLGDGMEVCWHIPNSWLLDASPRVSSQILRGLRTEEVHGGLGEVAASRSPPAILILKCSAI